MRPIKRKFNIVLMALVVYVYLFNPNLTKVDLRIVLDICGFILCLTTVIQNDNKVNMSADTRSIILGFCLFLGYQFLNLAVRMFLSTGIVLRACLKETRNLVVIFARVLFVNRSFYIFQKKLRFTHEDVVEAIFLSGIMQLICVILSFLYPSIRSFFNSFIINNSRMENVISYTLYVSQRGYGLAENLYDNFGYMISLIIILAYIKGIYINRTRYMILSFGMLAMPLLNARTGLVLVAIGILVTSMCFYKEIFIKNFFKYGMLVVLFIFVMIYVCETLPGNTMEWIGKGVDDIKNLLVGREKTGFFRSIMSNIIYPNNWLFGDGGSPDNLNVGHNDIGYLQCIWRYGLFGTAILLSSFFNAFRIAVKNAKKQRNKGMLCYVVCSAVFFYIYLFKMYSIGLLGGHFLIFYVGLIGMKEDKRFIRKEKIYLEDDKRYMNKTCIV